MTDEQASDLRGLSRVPAASSGPGQETNRVEPPPPPRPPLTRGAPPPIAPVSRPSALTRTGRWLWLLSALAGAVALVVAFLRRTDQFGRLRTLVEDFQSGRAAETVETVAAIAFWGTFGLLAVFLLAELMLRAATERSAAARWWMLLLVAVHAAAAAATISFLALDAEGTSTRLLVLAELLLAGAALTVTTIAAAVTPPPPPAQGRDRRRR